VLHAILNSLMLVAVFVGVVAWFVGFAAAARATLCRASRLLSTEVKAPQRAAEGSTAESSDRSMADLHRRMWKSALVFLVAIACAAGLALLRDWATGR
jgi:ABC-type uncharacterized transport system permease subunit